MIRIYLCTYNGARYLGEQLDSLRRQTCQDFELLISDDGSRDETRTIIERYREGMGRGLALVNGPKRGATANFLGALAAERGEHDLYAFCDQDDIWEQDKLARAVTWFKDVPQETPALYGARVRIVDENNHALSASHYPNRPLAFGNALVQNFTGGNAMVFNRAAFALIKASLENIDPASIPVHDWWAYLVVSGAGGVVYCDNYLSLRYRQHASNVIGASTGWERFKGRFSYILGTKEREWIGRNIEALQAHPELLNETNRSLLKIFSETRSAKITSRVAFALKWQIYRQTKRSDFGLLLGMMLRRI